MDFESLDENGYWTDTSEQAIAWRRRIFEERRIERNRKKRFDLKATANFWENYSQAGVKWAVALREFGALGGRCEYWCGVPNSASAIPLTFSLYAPDGTKLPCRYRLKDIKAAITTLRNAKS